MDDAERDAEAFRSLYRQHYRSVCRYLAARTERDLVEDVAAETFLVAWRRQREIPEHALPWLLATAGKCLANQRRSRSRGAALVGRLGPLLAASANGPDDELDRRDAVRALLAALGSLSDRDRELLLLRHWDGLAPREAATVLGLGGVLLRARLHRATRRLREELARELDVEGRSPHVGARTTLELTET